MSMSQIQTAAGQPLRYLSEKGVAEMTGFSLSKLQQDRHYRKGIPYSKIGRNIRYSLQDVLDYMDSRKISHEA